MPRKLKHWLLSLPIALLLALGSGCGTSIVDSGEKTDYSIQGAFIIDPNLESNPVSRSSKVAIRFKLDGGVVSTAEITFGGRTLNFECCQHCLDSLHWLANDSTYVHANTERQIILTDGTSFSDTLTAIIPDSFTITNVVPGNHLIQGSGQASLEWSGSTRAEAYVMAAVLADSAYTGYGYSAYTAELITSGTIPPEAFSLSPGPDPDTGLYNLYVYAIAGAPDITLANVLLPVPLPSQLPDNVIERDLVGRLGSVTVTLLDTVRVTQQP